MPTFNVSRTVTVEIVADIEADTADEAKAIAESEITVGAESGSAPVDILSDAEVFAETSYAEQV